jgi:hypothetical protein
MSFNDPLFNNYFRDTEDWVNLPLRDDVVAYEDPVENPSAFIEKLSKRAATSLIADDLDQPQPATVLDLLRSPELHGALRSTETRDRISAAVRATKKRARELQDEFGLDRATAIQKARKELGFEKSLAGR